MLKSITENLAVGSISDVERLKEVRQQGYQSIIDLCAAPEPNKLDENTVTDLGFQYISLPISMQNLNMETFKRFKETINSAPHPVYIRCASGLRAGVFTLLTLADKEGWTPEQYQGEFSKLGLEHKDNCPLASFAEDCLNKQ